MSTSSDLPLRDIPGSYGHPFLGPFKDRYDFFYCQGKEEFFKSRMEKYNSTIFRTNMPPGPFFTSNSKVVVLLDAVSFPILFDNNKVDKADSLLGTYRPSLDYFGGHRILSFLDPSEPKHHALKSWLLNLLHSYHKKIIPNFRLSLNELFENLDKEMSEKNKADFNSNSNSMSFAFIFKMFTDQHPAETPIGPSGHDLATCWILGQLAPIGTSGVKLIPSFIDDMLLRTAQLPFSVLKSNYQKIYHAFYASATTALDEAEKVGLDRGEACHNLVYISSFNSFGGSMITFSTLIKWVSSGGEDLHKRLAKEIRDVVKSNGVTYLALEKMPLTKSVVYETLRIEPPIPYQYGHAKEDIVVKSHEASFVIKKGEMIFGYQPFAMKDGRIFENPEQFVPERFMGEVGEKLKKFLYWSNGRETESPTPDDKMCPGKDLVILWCRLFLVEFFLRYDTFTSESKENIGFGSPVKITSLRKAT